MPTATERLRSMLAINRAIVGLQAPTGLFPLIVERVVTMLCGRAGALLLERARGRLELAAAVAVDPARRTGFCPPLDEHVSAALRWLFACTASETVEFAPVITGERIVGVLAVCRDADNQPDPDEAMVLAGLADQVALVTACAGLHARDDLLATVSHDLRTPLGTVVMTAATLDHQAGDGPGIHRHVGRIQRSAAYMARLIDELTDLMTLESGRFVLARAVEQVDRLLDDTLDMLAPAAHEKSLRVETRVDHGCAVTCDRERVLRVLTNLLGNAIKFSPEKSTISVSAEDRGDVVRFAVADRGPGIAASDLANVFLPYWRGRSGSHLGTGLGLYIARRIVDAHDGAIWAESAPGDGATFVFLLPTASVTSSPGSPRLP